MPFTPLHMGPGLVIKALLQGSFSLLIFGWSQILMDLQPLVAILTGEGQLHGVTHTYPGATLIALVSAVTGKYLSQWAGFVPSGARRIHIGWPVATLSAVVGSYTHVVLDSLMHNDIRPWFPVSESNDLLGAISVSALHMFCLYAGLVGAMGYFAVRFALAKHKRA